MTIMTMSLRTVYHCQGKAFRPRDCRLARAHRSHPPLVTGATRGALALVLAYLVSSRTLSLNQKQDKGVLGSEVKAPSSHKKRLFVGRELRQVTRCQATGLLLVDLRLLSDCSPTATRS